MVKLFRISCYSDPSSNTGVKGSDHGVLRKAVFRILIGKIGLRERKRLRTPRPHCPSLKIIPFWTSNVLHSAWVADAASFRGG
jgi:hypothetical protein